MNLSSSEDESDDNDDHLKAKHNSIAAKKRPPPSDPHADSSDDEVNWEDGNNDDDDETDAAPNSTEGRNNDKDDNEIDLFDSPPAIGVDSGPDSIVIDLDPSSLLDANSATASSKPVATKKKKRNLTTTAISLNTLLKANPHLHRYALALHKSSILAFAAVAIHSSKTASSITFASKIMSCYSSPDGIGLELDYFMLRDCRERPKVGSKSELRSIFKWFNQILLTSSSSPYPSSHTSSSSSSAKKRKKSIRQRFSPSVSSISSSSSSSIYSADRLSSSDFSPLLLLLTPPPLPGSRNKKEDDEDLTSFSSSLPRAVLLAGLLRSNNYCARVVLNIPAIMKDDVRAFLDIDRIKAVGAVLPLLMRRAQQQQFTFSNRPKAAISSAENPILLDSDDDDDDAEDDTGSNDKSSVAKVTKIVSKPTPMPTTIAALAPFFPSPLFAWVEAFCPEENRWIHADPTNKLFDQPESVEGLLSKFWKGHPGSSQVPKEYAGNVVYVLGIEHKGILSDDCVSDSSNATLTDVTKRYAASYSKSSLLREEDWFQSLLSSYSAAPAGNSPSQNTSSSSSSSTSLTASALNKNRLPSAGLSSTTPVDLTFSDDDDEDDDCKVVSTFSAKAMAHASREEIEQQELEMNAFKEKVPTTVEGFKNHPKFALSSQLKRNDVLHPTASRRHGVHRGEFIFQREDVHIAKRASKWLYSGRKVRDSELDSPAKLVKKRASNCRGAGGKGNFEALNAYTSTGASDGTKESEQREKDQVERDMAQEKISNADQERLYGEWQTDSWKPPTVLPGGTVPKNEFGNIELKLMNPGLVHIRERGVSKVAKSLGISYAPCLTGFDTMGRPQIVGICVLKDEETKLRTAYQKFLANESEKWSEMIAKRWGKLVIKMRIGEDLAEEWGVGKK